MSQIHHHTRPIQKSQIRLTRPVILFSFAMLLLLSSCKKFLDMPVKDKVPQDALFSSEEGFIDALTGVYLGMDKPGSLPTKGLYTSDLSIGMLSVMANNYTNASSSILGDQLYSNTSRYDYNQDVVKQEIGNFWSGMYNNIANLNNLLSRIDSKKDAFTRDYYSRIKGESLALRALFHFDLARSFGQSPVTGKMEKAIPYITRFTSSSTPFLTLNAVLDSCLSDLNTAKDLLAKTDTTKVYGGSTELFSAYTQNHLNYWAAKALLARIYLYKGDYVNARINAGQVIASNKFPLSTENAANALVPTRDRLFSKELIFSVYSSNVMKINEGLFNLTSGTSLQLNALNKEAIYGKVVPPRTGDWRLSWFDNNVVGVNVPSKFFQNANLPYLMQNIVPVIRVSEMYYILAECANAAADLSTALGYLNKLRKARGLDDLTNVNVPDHIALSAELTKEYKREFMQEGQTFFYYKRLNKDLKVETGTTVPVPANAYVFPVPDKEIENNQ